MKDWSDFFDRAWVGAFLVSMLVVAMPSSYRQGQIDALNGKVQYVQEKNDDGEMVWVRKEIAK